MKQTKRERLTRLLDSLICRAQAWQESSEPDDRTRCTEVKETILREFAPKKGVDFPPDYRLS